MENNPAAVAVYGAFLMVFCAALIFSGYLFIRMSREAGGGRADAALGIIVCMGAVVAGVGGICLIASEQGMR